MIKKISIHICFCLLLAYLVFVVMKISRIGADRVCEGVSIEMVQKPGDLVFMSEADVKNELEQMNLGIKGRKMDSICVYDIEAKLHKNPLFTSSDVYLSKVSNKVVLRIQQKDPMFLVQSQDSTYYVSKSRGIIPRTGRYVVDVPYVSGKLTQEYALGPVFDLITTINKDPFWKHFFTQFYVKTDGSIVMMPRMSNTYIIMGTTPQWDTKLYKLKVFYDEIISRVGWDSYKSLNLEFKGQVVATTYDGVNAPEFGEFVNLKEKEMADAKSNTDENVLEGGGVRAETTTENNQTTH